MKQNTPNIKIFSTINELNSSSGGPSRTVVELNDALANFPKLEINLIYQNSFDQVPVKSFNPGVRRLELQSKKSLQKILALPIRSFLKGFDRSDHGFTIIHDNGLWLPINHWVAAAARRWNVPLIIQTHGMLQTWAFEHKNFKKNIALYLYQRRNLNAAKVLVASSQDEYLNLRKFGLKQPIAIIPNGINFSTGSIGIDYDHVLQSHNRTVLFISRINKVKGLLNLIQAWGVIRPAGWDLIIAGPNHDGYLSDVISQVQKLGLANCVRFYGELDDTQKTDFYKSADIFVLPTFSENFGLVVAEALSNGVPVITTKGAPWADLETYKCGWWIDIGVDPLVNALRNAISLTDEERHLMGRRGQEYISRFNWQDISADVYNLYNWVVGVRPKPECVFLD